MKRLVFLGAMNRDLVAHIPAAAMLSKLRLAAPPLLETPVSDAVAEQGASLFNALGAADHLGGSAFNAARIVALLDAETQRLALSFLGLAGRVGQAAPHLDALRDWGIAADGVQHSALPPATCLAMVESAGRTLLTASGANAGIATWLSERGDDLARRIADADLIHVTSYLDPAAPGLIAAILAEARRRNPHLRVSLDPGAAWVLPGGAGFEQLLAQADILHLNQEELAHLCGSANPATLGGRLHPRHWLIVARTHCGATLYEDRGDAPSAIRKLPDTPLPAAIVDATGAGDTFCGGFLWHLLANRADPLDAARLGFTLARAKVGKEGPLTAEDISSGTAVVV